MRMIQIGMMLVLLAMTGCIKVKDELTLREDGSGTVTLEIKSKLPAEMMGGDFRDAVGGMGGGAGIAPYPPLTQAMAQELFPAKDFTVKATAAPAKTGTDRTLTVEAQFKDVNALLNSPYGKAHSLQFVKDGTTLQFKALSGMQLVAAINENKEAGQGMAMQYGQFGIKPEDLAVEFRITLPSVVTSGNGQKDGKSVAWIVDRSKIKDGAEAVRQLSSVMEASCAASGLKFTPESPLRLDLMTFESIKEGVIGTQGKLPDTNQILKATRYVPQVLQTSRTIDLTGEASGGYQQASLTGYLAVPRTLAPVRIGEAKLLQVTDDTGKDLLPPAPTDEQYHAYMNQIQAINNPNGDDGDEAVPATASDQHYNVTFAFKTPEWKVREITRLRATVALPYYGASQLIKVEKAVAKVFDPETSTDFEPPKPLVNATLKQLGLELTPQQAMMQEGMTMIMLQSKGSQAAVKEIQVFDADGHPCPGMFANGGMGGGGGGDQLSIMLPGKPKPPFSFALIVDGSATTVLVPIQLDHIPLTNPAK